MENESILVSVFPLAFTVVDHFTTLPLPLWDYFTLLTLYLFYGIEPNFECPGNIDDHGTGTLDADYRILRAMWKGIKPVIDKKLSEIDNGSKGGRPKKDKRPMREDD